MNESPLSTRITAPSAPPIPTATELHWRPGVTNDIDDVTALMRAADAVDHPNFLTTREEIAEDFESSFVDTAFDTLIGVDDAGTPVAYGIAMLPPGQDTLVRSILFGTVHPHWRGRGIGRQLLRWQEARALQQLASSQKTLPGWIVAYINERSVTTDQLFDRAGFETARYYFELTRVLDEPIPVVPLPPEFAIAHPRSEQFEQLRLARNDAFRDHWGSQPTSEEQWRAFASRPMFRPDLSFVVTAPNGDIAGFVLSEVNEDDWPGQGFSSGYIDLVGVTRAWRGRGVAPAMLASTLTAFRDEGLDRAVLDVDSESLTGALRLYEGVGFTPASRTRAVYKVY
jgi:ribosomal protein S18 acetylase RimI-like enzyme